nr:MAG TPA: hypothetical protein [Caudoviricetes sp.]
MLKNILSLLLSKFYSKQESELVGHQAMPSSTWTAISLSQTTSDSWTPIGSYTAPNDGYIQLQGEATADASQLAIRTENNGEVRGSFICRTVYQVSGVNLVVAKGQTCLLLSSHSKNIKARFYQIIGGGYQTLKKQGGGLCLNSLSSSLRRSSCRVRRNGSEVKVFSQTQIPEQRSLLTTLRLNFIRLQVMDGLRSAETDHRSMSALPESWERVALTLKVISELQLRFGRGIPLVSIARRTISNRLRQNSFPAKGQRNTSLVGGASC